MFNKKLILFIAIVFAVLNGNTQSCALSIKGQVSDEASEIPLSFVNVYIQELSKNTATDEKGNFLLENICEGKYHLIFAHIGCEEMEMHINISKDTIINIELQHTSTSLGTIVIESKKIERNIQSNLSVNRKAIEDNSNQNISDLIENETGVHLIKNGSGISKPVVHGLYGNRLTILNNGIVQNGQQWGNDHSPEIDPFAADKIVVLKGTSAIEYGGSNLGSVILVEPKRIIREPLLHGQLNYVFETNGRGHSMNFRLEKYNSILPWKINASFKRYGDRNTKDYFLNNTGTGEGSFAVQFEKSLKDKFFLEFYASSFNTEIGILRGSHIGNITDLEQALSNNVPFFTEPNFSYDIDAPKQNVSHHLVKGKAKYYLKEHQVFEFVIANQINNRKEFDVRRSGRSELPALSLSQNTTNLELKYTHDFNYNWNLKIGNQNILTDNTNNPETGILPLIPDYISWKSGLFSTISKSTNNTHFNIGVRYDYENQNALTISKSLPREIISYENQFHNFAGLFAIKINIPKNQSINFNSGYAMRNPAINELYSYGLHQGVSGIEEGDINLNTEKAFKNTLEYKWFSSTKFSLGVLAYNQYFKDYIFLNPQDEIRLTIRGAFPVFKYEQTDANIYGLDFSTQFTINNSLFGNLKYSYLRGKDTKNNIPLVFMPPNTFYGSLTYQIKKPKKLSENILLEETEIEINNKLVLQQNNILPEQDFVLPPPTYNLFGLKVSTNLIFPHYKIRFFAKANNLFNVRYREYLNRQRYFADDIGLSLTIGVNFKF